ncbi:MAG: Glu/Leu/Phe/Val dehydrogenase [Candidatus Niyogibacteria bacterium]|nr:Glu/Leu/Phe/Val dehydrogenase [Candidatus Niyogibacteria bacterium]
MRMLDFPEEILLKDILGIPVAVFIHSTKRGPALGGTRALNYSEMIDFFNDGLKLSSAMTFKAIWARLPLGGGKAIINADGKEITNKEFTKRYAEFLNEINAKKIKFITSVDIGCGEEFVDMVSQYTPYITGRSVLIKGLGDPSPQTAKGVFLAIKTAVELDGNTLQGKICNVQGAGKVAMPLMKMLVKEGSFVYFSEKDGDPFAENKAQEAEKIGAIRVSENGIYDLPCHIFIPCAIGGTMNKSTISRLSSLCRFVIGGANNILNTPEDGILLHQRKTFYVPDFIVNRWGLEWVTQEKNGVNNKLSAEDNLSDIQADVKNILRISRAYNFAPSELADIISQKILDGKAKSIEDAYNNNLP